ncbi:MAG: type IV secretory system conjugative DNA transfer family protein [Bacteroidota bacterium]
MLESYYIWMIFHLSLSFLLGLVIYFSKQGFWINLLLISYVCWSLIGFLPQQVTIYELLLKITLPASGINILLFAFLPETHPHVTDHTFCLKLNLKNRKLQLENIRKGISVIGAAGSGKTQSVVYNTLEHFRKHSFSGLIHDYKDFELTELAYPLFKNGDLPFYIISFDQCFHRVNPIAPRYMTDQESINEMARVLLVNLTEQRDVVASGTLRFFHDVAEGIIAGLIWKIKTEDPLNCNLPYLINCYQAMDNQSLAEYLSSDPVSRNMAAAYINGLESERQTAAARSTLSNAFKKITSNRIFDVLSKDEIPLDINNPDNPAVVCIVNNPKFETAYTPVISSIIHTIIKQMSVRDRCPSFLLMEEAPTIRLLHMHRVPATLRSFNICTVYVMQDRSQIDLVYGEKASRAIMSNLSYQFFGKVNDPDTAKYFERFFELIQKDSISISEGQNLDFDARITRSKREVAQLRADLFFRLQPGEFVCYADGKAYPIVFENSKIIRELPKLSLGKISSLESPI